MPHPPQSQIEDLIAQEMERWHVPGAAVAIVQDGEVIFTQAFGSRDKAQSLPVTPDTLFAIASCSKAFTAMTVGMLVDEGKLAWNQPVRQYIPEFQLQDSFASERITPRDLLCHNSGLPRHDLVWYQAANTPAELIERLRHLQPGKDFRANWQYQNMMYMIAGLLVSEASGKSWEDFTRQRIFEPLGMTASSFSAEAARQTGNIALPYEENEGDISLLPYYEDALLGAAGGIYSNITDLVQWVRLLLNGGSYSGNRLVSEQAFKTITNPHIVIDDPTRNELIQSDFLTYGLGWTIHPYHGRKLLFHGGAIDGFTSRIAFMPDEQIATIVLNNLEDSPLPITVTYSIYDLLLEQKPQPWSDRVQALRDKAEAEKAEAQRKFDAARQNTSPLHPLDAYTGVYRHPGYGQLRITVENDHLAIVFNTMTWHLQHVHDDVFEVKAKIFDPRIVTASFQTDTQGSIQQVCIPMQEGVGDIIFARVDNEAHSAIG